MRQAEQRGVVSLRSTNVILRIRRIELGTIFIELVEKDIPPIHLSFWRRIEIHASNQVIRVLRVASPGIRRRSERSYSEYRRISRQEIKRSTRSRIHTRSHYIVLAQSLCKTWSR